MKNLITAASILTLSATGALAGGLDRSGQGIGIIFEEGGFVELSYGNVSPSVTLLDLFNEISILIFSHVTHD